MHTQTHAVCIQAAVGEGRQECAQDVVPLDVELSKVRLPQGSQSKENSGYSISYNSLLSRVQGSNGAEAASPMVRAVIRKSLQMEEY
jgi:hypothetical protein